MWLWGNVFKNRLMYYLRDTSQALQAVVLEDSHQWLGRGTSYAMSFCHSNATRPVSGLLQFTYDARPSLPTKVGKRCYGGHCPVGRPGQDQQVRVVHPVGHLSNEFCTLAESCYGSSERVATDIGARAINTYIRLDPGVITCSLTAALSPHYE